MIYLPDGGTVGVDTSRLAGDQPAVTWLNPRTGESQPGEHSADRSFTAPDQHDGVLILDADDVADEADSDGSGLEPGQGGS